MQQALFEQEALSNILLAPGAYYLPRFCSGLADQLWWLVCQHLDQFPPTRMMTPMGHQMSVKTSSMGDVGWTSSINGYGYQRLNPITCKAWPPIPTMFIELASRAAKVAGYGEFEPDTCLINMYEPGAKMGLHQDKDELDFNEPIVSVSLGIDATFLFGGSKRSDPIKKCAVSHGDVVVFGGESRCYYHGVNRIKQATHPVLGPLRCNLTLRKAV